MSEREISSDYKELYLVVFENSATQDTKCIPRDLTECTWSVDHLEYALTVKTSQCFLRSSESLFLDAGCL